MPSTIFRVCASEFDELIAFLDAAFGHDTPDRSFVHLLPALYQRDDEHCQCNYAIRVDGRIAAVVGVFPINWQTPGGPLRIAGIGGVSVGRDFRRTGLMKELMLHVRERIVEAGYHLSYLGGQRQRYRYFGWEIAGSTVVADIDKRNLHHAFGDAAVPVTLDERPDPSALAALHDAQPYHCRRTDMAPFLRQWFCHPVAARDVNGRVIGYAVINNEGKRIHELVAISPDAATQVVRAVVAANDHWGVSVVLQPGQVDHIRAMSSLSERMRVEHAGNWQIIDWPTTIGTLMRARHAASPLVAGDVTLAAGGTAFRMIVDSAGPRCEPGAGPATFTADPAMMTRLLLGPLQPHMVAGGAPAILDAWCPLPLSISTQDHV